MSPRKKSPLGPSPLRTVTNASSLSPSRSYQDSDTDTDSSLSAEQDEDEVEMDGDFESSQLKAEPVHWEQGMRGDLAKYSWLQQAEAKAERGGKDKVESESVRKGDADAGEVQRREDEGNGREMSLGSSGSSVTGEKRISRWDGLFEDGEGPSREKTDHESELGEVEGRGKVSDAAKLKTHGEHSGGGTGSHLEPDDRPSLLGRRKRRYDDADDQRDNSKPSKKKNPRSGRLL